MNEKSTRGEALKSGISQSAIRVCRAEGRLPLPEGQEAALHYHDALEFLIVYEGELTCSAGGRKYIAKAGGVLFIGSRVPHKISFSEGARVGLLQLREAEPLDSEEMRLIKYSLRFRAQVSSPVRVFTDSLVFGAVGDVITEQEKKLPSYRVLVKSYVYKLLGILYRTGTLADAESVYAMKEMQKVLPLLSYIHTAYSENITLEEVSERLGFDRSYFCRIFKTATGATFTEYLNFLRVSKAANMLSRSREGIAEISAAVGFSSVSYFSRIFKRYRGCSPGFYRTVIFCTA